MRTHIQKHEDTYIGRSIYTLCPQIDPQIDPQIEHLYLSSHYYVCPHTDTRYRTRIQGARYTRAARKSTGKSSTYICPHTTMCVLILNIQDTYAGCSICALSTSSTQFRQTVEFMQKSRALQDSLVQAGIVDRQFSLGRQTVQSRHTDSLVQADICGAAQSTAVFVFFYQ